jgi:hypothetical protein
VDVERSYIYKANVCWGQDKISRLTHFFVPKYSERLVIFKQNHARVGNKILLNETCIRGKAERYLSGKSRALSSLVSKFSLEYAIRRVQVKQKGFKLTLILLMWRIG